MAGLLYFFLTLALTLRCQAQNQETIGGLPLDTQYLTNRNILNRTIQKSDKLCTSSNRFGSLSLSIQCDSENLEYFEDTEYHNLSCNFSYTSDRDFSMNFYSDYPASVALVGEHNFTFPAAQIKTSKVVDFQLQVAQIGDAFLVGRVTVNDSSSLALGIRLLVRRKTGALDITFRVILVILLILATFFMGCEVDLTVVVRYLKKPVGPLIGFLCQFCVMPGASSLPPD